VLAEEVRAFGTFNRQLQLSVATFESESNNNAATTVLQRLGFLIQLMLPDGLCNS
jgi:hypothetical protein